MKVVKFGGTSVSSAVNINRVRNIIANYRANDQIFVVVSALGGITNELERLIQLSISNRAEAVIIAKQIIRRHEYEIKILFEKEPEVLTLTLKSIKNELLELVSGIHIIGEVTPRAKDKVMSMGERISSLIVAEFFNLKFNTRLINPVDWIITDEKFGNANINYKRTYEAIAKLRLKQDEVVVSPGFIGGTENGELTTLGRGGSDFSAALFARGLGAVELAIWTDVSGMMTADPRIVKTARVINKLTYEEAMELSHFGAKVIYPPTIQPVFQKGIPIRIKNTLKPEDEGTLITINDVDTDKTVQGLTSIKDLVLVNMKGSGMVGVPSLSYRLFKAFAKKQINIILITQASSEHTISIVISSADAAVATFAVNEEFAMEIELGRLDPLEVEKDLAIVALVGSNMKHQVGVSGKMFTILGANGVNIKAIAQGSSERNISVVIQANDLKKAINSLHEGFFLSERKRLNLFVVGVGVVGNVFLKQLREQGPVLLKSEQLDIRVVGLANSKKMDFNEEGIDLQSWRKTLGDSEKMDISAFVKKMIQLNLRNSIFIDNTSTEIIPSHYLKVLSNSISVVTPNKVAASSKYDEYLALKRAAMRYKAQFLFETNVGAGLPVISTLKDLVKSGDKILAIEAVLSGSLNFIFNNYNGQKSFASVVKLAKEEGYTEPDPRIDLSGLDVKRKLLILMREAGVACDLDDIESEGFMDNKVFDQHKPEMLYAKLEEQEPSLAKMYAKAAKNKEQLKYVASYRNGVAKTKLMSVPHGHHFYNLEGKDNIVLFYTQRYNDQPLTIKGAGAGAEVTASGIFADVIKVAHS